MNIDVLSGDRVRLPKPSAGVALAIHRYRAETAFVLHPSDFHRLQTLEELVSSMLALPSLELSAEAVEAHLDEGSPGQPITDPGTLDELFDS